MLRRIGTLLVVAVWCSAAFIPSSGLESGDSEARVYTLAGTVKIPLKAQGSNQSTPPEANINSPTLLASPGAEDELPDGPNGFDVSEDGRLLISDPLADRVAVFDAQGNFKQSWKLDFSPDSVTLVEPEVVVVRDASTGDLHAFNLDGHPQSLPRDVAPNLGEATLKSGNTAVVTPQAPGGQPTKPLEVSLGQPGVSLLSVEILAVDKDGNTFLAVESTKGGDQVNVQKDVWKYSASGNLLGKVAQIPLDYYIPPVNELRVRNGVVYQLDTTKSEVRINMWNTKEVLAGH